MSEIDFSRVLTLLSCARELALHSGLKTIKAAVQAELDAIDNPPSEEVEEEQEEVSNERRA